MERRFNFRSPGAGFVLLTALLLTVLSGTRPALAAEADEYEIKATLLANVLRLVDWPPVKGSDAQSPLIVGIAGSEEMEAALRKAAGRSAGRALLVRRIAGVEGMEQCQAIFVGGTDRKRLSTIIQGVHSQAVLTLGESDRFMSEGGMVGLVLDDDHVKVLVNLNAAQATGLQISSRLLRIATIRGGGHS